MPYRTLEDLIDGIVITFTDITLLKEMEAAAQYGRKMSEGIVNTVREPLLVLDGKLRVVSANRSFFKSFQVAAEDTLSKSIYDLGNRQWNIPALKQLLEKLLPEETEIEGFRVEHKFDKIGRRVILVNARRLEIAPELPQMILMALEDVTKRSEDCSSE